MSYTTNQFGIDLIKKFEGFRASAYKCPADIWTIGYGHTGSVNQGQRLTESLAEQLLCKDLSSAECAVRKAVNVALNENQFASLVSFAFNAGTGALRSSTLLRNLNSGDYDSIPAELKRWSKIKDPVTGTYKTLAGLLKRRIAEGKLWQAVGSFIDDSNLPEEEEAASLTELIVYEEHCFIRFEVTAESGLKLRDGPSSSNEVITVLPFQSLLYVAHKVGDWIAVDLDGDGAIDGWVAEEFLSPLIR